MIWNNFRQHDQFSEGTSQSFWLDVPKILNVYMSVKNGAKTNCGIVHIFDNLLMTSYSC